MRLVDPKARPAHFDQPRCHVAVQTYAKKRARIKTVIETIYIIIYWYHTIKWRASLFAYQKSKVSNVASIVVQSIG